MGRQEIQEVKETDSMKSKQTAGHIMSEAKGRKTHIPYPLECHTGSNPVLSNVLANGTTREPNLAKPTRPTNRNK